MVTTLASGILRLHRGEGTLRVGAVGDLIAVRYRIGNPAEILTRSSWRDIELVLVDGNVRLASSGVFNRLPAQARLGLTPLEVEGEIRWIRGPMLEFLRLAETVLGAGNVRVGGLRVSIAEEVHDAS
jgi:hypothetical protein